MTKRRSSLFAALSLFVLGWWTRAIPLWWSPLPATLDGWVYARLARETLSAGSVPLNGFRADAFGSTLLTTIVSAILEVTPLRLLQPLYALIGAVTVLLGFVFVRRLGREYNWSYHRIRAGSILAAFGLAVEGIFVRRTGVPDDDAITLLLIPIAVLLLYRYVDTGRHAWLGVLLPLLIVFPFIHTFSTFILGFSLLALSALLFSQDTEHSRALTGGLIVGGFWVYFTGYYTLIGDTILFVPYVGRVTSHPGLFLGWLVVLVVGVVWYQQTTWRLRRMVAAVPLGLFFIVAIVNAQTTVFPATAQTPRIVVLSLVPLAVPAVYGAWASPLLGERHTTGSVLLALFGAPVATVMFALTASLTPEFFATAMRAQTHFHLPVVVVGGVLCAHVVSTETTRVLGRSVSLPASGRAILVGIFVIAVAGTLPVAHVNLDTGSAPSTSLESEFAAATFSSTYLPDGWTSSHTQVRIANSYYDGATGSVAPTRQWLRGGPPPSQPVVAQHSWTTTGAHLFPLAPRTLPSEQFIQWQQQNNVVYRTTGHDTTVIVIK